MIWPEKQKMNISPEKNINQQDEEGSNNEEDNEEEEGDKEEGDREEGTKLVYSVQ